MIKVNDSKCIGCNACVRACPINVSNIAKNINGKVIIEIDEYKCISCGECLDACKHHGARFHIDDTDDFIKNAKNMSLIVAPAIRTIFPDNWKNVIAYLRHIGVKRIYDVSFGADICTWAHLLAVEKGLIKNIISQPCAAIVNYMLKYKSDKLNYLSPIHSPMACTAIYVKKHLGDNAPLAALSPCIAKKEEFIQTGLIDMNVTFQKLKEHLSNNKVLISQYKLDDSELFDNISECGGNSYPIPGGLMRCLQILNPELTILTSEGTNKVYKEIDQYLNIPDSLKPNIFDVLSCEFGCCIGPCSANENNLFAIKMQMLESQIKISKSKLLKQLRKFKKTLDFNDYIRIYDKSLQIKLPEITPIMLEKAYISLEKCIEDENQFNCRACGFDSCNEMAKAISLGINLPENCIQKQKKNAIQALSLIEKHNILIHKTVEKSSSNLQTLNESINLILSEITSINKINSDNNDDADILSAKINELVIFTKKTVEAVSFISSQISNYEKMAKNVESIAFQSNILALNASIEAARAGVYGLGFSIVATEVRNLSEKSNNSVMDVVKYNNSVLDSVNNTVKHMLHLQKEISSSLLGISDLKDNISLANESGNQILTSIENVYAMADSVKSQITDIDKL